MGRRARDPHALVSCLGFALTAAEGIDPSPIRSEKWTGFHDDAAKSKGVGRQTESAAADAEAPKKQEPKPLSPELQQAADGCMEDYEYLRSFAHHDW